MIQHLGCAERSVALPARNLRACPPDHESTGTGKEMAVTDGGLAGVRAIEMGQLLAGPFCGQLLGDFGAEVIKVEPPGKGDPMRDWGREKPHGKSLWWPIL